MTAAGLLLIFPAVVHFDETLTLVSYPFLVKWKWTTGPGVVCFQCGHIPVLVCPVFVFIFPEKGQLITYHDKALNLGAGPGLETQLSK